MNSQVVNGSGSAAGMSREQTSRVIRILEGYLGKLEQGCPPDPDELLARHPELSDVLRIYLDKLALLHHAATGLRDPNQAEDVAPAALLPERGRLGDFRILREIGRGGMGVVYEAEQISLSRRVALKVLPFTTALDGKQLQRFKKEAQAAAQLHHTHIVPVYFVGVDRGVHYYAMQFIEGQTLAAMITEMRQLTGLRRAEQTGLALNGSQVNGSKTLTRAIANKTMPRNGTVEVEAVPLQEQAEVTTAAPATFITRRSTRSPVFFRTAARLGIQAAEALEHAHQMGVVHRDVKPANLLVDARSHVWITDFGLALYQSENGLTLTGDLLGTLRYMSPEQAMAKRFLVDHRTDVYSLGVTLYELLTLEPAYDGKDRQELLKQIAFEEPRPPRQVNPAIPVELETVVLKAMAKELDERYASAQELADDLRRFLENKPILAKRPTLWERTSKWARRHRAIVLTAVGLLILAMGALLTFTLLLMAEQKKTWTALKKMEAKEAEARAQEIQAKMNWERAEKNFNSACMGVFQLLFKLQDKQWDDVPEIRRLRLVLKDQGINFLKEFIADKNPDPTARSRSARTYSVIGRIQLLSGDISKSREMYQKAIDLCERLAEEFPDNLNYRFSVAYTQTLLGKALHAKGLLREAAAEFAKAKQNYRLAFPDAVKWSVDYNPAEAANCYAWFLVTCPDLQQRNASEAIAAAKRALDIVEETGYQCPQSMSWRYLYSNTLGVALYRAGKPKEAIETLKRSMKLLNGGTSWDWYPLAMAYFVTGDKKQALAWYHKAVSVKEPPKFDHYLEMDTTEPFRLEAETVLHLQKTEAKSLETSRN